jgi:cardiolipin synthase A/B
MSLYGWALLGVDVALALYTSSHILLNKRHPRSALLWLVWVWLLPILGSLGYLYFGYNRVGRPPHRPVPLRARRSRGGLDRLSAAVSGTPLRQANRVAVLIDGTQGYPAMLDAIRAASRSLDLQTYIFDLDGVGEAILQALEEAARRGVRVRVLCDGMAAWGARPALRRRLRAVGGDARAYWQVDRLFKQPLFNLRMHRKLLIADGGLAFTGGLNISQRYAKGPLARLRDLNLLASSRPQVRDVHFRIRGPLVGDLAQVFEQDWRHAHGPELPLLPGPGAAFGPVPGETGPVALRVVKAGPDEDLERVYELLLGALSQARERVDLCTPYFIPDAVLLAQLRLLGYRGVKVRLFVPARSDHPYMNWAAQEYFDDLLDAGVQVWQVGEPFIHTKLCLVDDDWVLLGSSNLDPRSFRLNFELNVEARSRRLLRRLRLELNGYRRGAVRVTPQSLARRTALQRLRGALINLAAPYL